MYTSFFGLRENPFNLTPDPRYLFLSPYHKEALDHLLYGINERKGFIAIAGGIGTGKTTLCRALLSHMDASTKSALVFNASISDMELLKTINQEFGIQMDTRAVSKKDHIDVLNHFLLKNFSQGGNAFLLIDEAQNLSHTVLEQIRMLSNLETEREKLIQIVLVGQPELKELLAAPSLRQLNERIMVRYDLRPLRSRDIQGYVEHRLVVAGSKGNVRFTNGVFKKISAYSQGNPRRINAVCDRALLIAHIKEEHTISKGTVAKAIEELHADMRIQPVVADWSWKRVVSSTLILLLLIMVAGFAGWSLREHIFGIFPVEQKTAPEKISKPINTPPTDIEPKKEPASLFLDEIMSLAGLFRLFNNSGATENNQDFAEAPISLVSFNVEPKYYVMFKKPFRLHVSDLAPTPSAGPHYLLIREVTEEGAVAVDAEGKERPVTRDFILNYRGPRLSWFYLHKNSNLFLMKGMDIPEVLEVQITLNEIGYEVAPTGVYDDLTLKSVKEFQRDLGMKADGIVGPRTRPLLFQMSK